MKKMKYKQKKYSTDYTLLSPNNKRSQYMDTN